MMLHPNVEVDDDMVHLKVVEWSESFQLKIMSTMMIGTPPKIEVLNKMEAFNLFKQSDII